MAALKSETVRVVVRVRPLSVTESNEAIAVNPGSHSITITKPRDEETGGGKEFTFDEVFGPLVSQADIYSATAMDIVDRVMEGFNGTIFAYGQTGAGKTYTMTGGKGEAGGIIPRVFRQIFSSIEKNSFEGVNFLLQVSFLEIYNDEIRDLLGSARNAQLQDKSDGSVGVKGISIMAVKSEDEMAAILSSGSKNRSTGSTLMNSESSRSHSLFTIVVESSDTKTGRVRMGKLNLVDLAGSERQSKTGAVGDTLREAAKINLSLSALGNVISALVEGSKSGFVPYRDSKLTRLLQDSLGGNTKTVMISNIGPAACNYEESLSTLRFSARAKRIQNKPRINEDPKDTQIRGFQEEIERLRRELAMASDSVPIKSQLAEMETKLLQGHQAVESELIATRAELERKARAEADIRQRLADQAEERQVLEDRFVTQIDQVGDLKKKLEKVVGKYRRIKDDMRDLQIEFQEERESIIATIRELQKMVKLNDLILSTLNRPDDIHKVESRCWFDDEANEWRLREEEEEERHLPPVIDEPIPKYDVYSKKPSWETMEDLFTEIQKSVYFHINQTGSLVREFDPLRLPLEVPLDRRPRTAAARPTTADRTGRRPNLLDETIPRARGLVKPDFN